MPAYLRFSCCAGSGRDHNTQTSVFPEEKRTGSGSQIVERQHPMEISGGKIRSRRETKRPRLDIGWQQWVSNHQRRRPHLEVGIRVSAPGRIEAVAEGVVKDQVTGSAQGEDAGRAQRTE